ncbi:MAG TPA: GNAT family N-acetyltransferase [Pseudonocardiaceae bacterium]
MLADHFPPYGLRLRTPRLELRLPDLDELAELADLAVAGIHPPDTMPFLTPWTLEPPADIARSVLRKYWKALSEWTPQEWVLKLAVFHEGTAIGVQEISAKEFAVRREVSTGSWLGQRYQGKGFGVEMRAAVLDLGFTGLGAEEAVSFALASNAASLAVSRKLGYTVDGTERQVVQGRLAIDTRQRLTREAWRQHRTVDVEIEGLEPCRGLFGLA